MPQPGRGVSSATQGMAQRAAFRAGMLFGQFAHGLPRDPEQRERAVGQVRHEGRIAGVQEDIAPGEADPFPCGGQAAVAV